MWSKRADVGARAGNDDKSISSWFLNVEDAFDRDSTHGSCNNPKENGADSKEDDDDEIGFEFC
jgi:hypothetical protein